MAEGIPSGALAIPKRKVIEFKNQSLWAKSHFMKTLGTGKISCIVLLANGLPCGRVYNSKTASTNLVHHMKAAHHMLTSLIQATLVTDGGY